MSSLYKLLVLVMISFQATLHAQDICDEVKGDWPVLAGGRIKPLLVLSQESLKFMTGKSNPWNTSAIKTFCQLSFLDIGMKQPDKIEIKVDHVDVRKILGLNENSTHIGVTELENQQMTLRSAMMKIKENNSTKKEIQKVLSRFALYDDIKQGKIWTFATIKQDKITWIPLSDYLTQNSIDRAKETQKGNPIIALMMESKDLFDKKEKSHYLLEYHFVKTHYFSWALVLSLLALVLTFSIESYKLGLITTFISIGIQITGMTMRVLISGRAPITNMYETVMFSGFGALVIGVGLILFYKNKNFLMGGLAYNCLCLMMMMFANGMLDPGISPLVPVLRDNFWLSTHVTTVILSYAALALSWILANLTLLRKRFWPQTSNMVLESQLIYTAIKFGVVLLSAGIILGGVWADYSWGRFWGWDPKETWSLIVLLIYIAILHGRYTQWIPAKRFIPLVAASFMSVMMAWFGVNYILASGLHSYGFSEGGAIFLGSIFLIQMFILVICLWSFNEKKAL